MKCNVCGIVLPDNARFCGVCGTEQIQQPVTKNTCIHCGMELEADIHFCPQCGTSQQPPESQEDAPILPEIEAEELPVAECTLPEIETEPPAAEAEPEIESEPEAEITEAPEEAPIVEPEPEPEPEPVAPVQPEPQPIPQPEPVVVTPPQPKYQQPQQQYQSPYQQPVYQPAYQPQQNVQVNLHGAIPQRPMAPIFAPPQPPAYQLPCKRGLLKMLLLTPLTAGIYPMVIFSRMSMEINMVASRHDGKYTIHFMWLPILAALTLCIYPFLWIHELCNRIGGELNRRQIKYRFNAASFWLWNLLYGFIATIVTAVTVYILYTVVALEEYLVILIGVGMLLLTLAGPWIFIHKMMKAMNLVNADYNRRG